MKICDTCGEKKSRDDFYRLRHKCNDCYYSHRRKLENETKHTHRDHKTKEKQKVIDQIIDDFDKSDRYNMKFLKRTHGHKRNDRYGRYLIGNSTSSSHSRPSGSVICRTRLDEKIINIDTEQHHTVDNHTLETPYIYRKTSIQTIVSYESNQGQSQQKMNMQLTSKPVPSHKHIDCAKMTPLPEINDNLFIGNYLSTMDDNQLKNRKISVIINVSGTPLLYSSNKQMKIYSLDYKDTRQLSYRELKHILDRVIEIMDLNENKKILIVCNKGVNRSVSLAIGYAILKKNMTFDQAYEYIDTQKNKRYEHFHSLTNPKIKNLLKALSSQYSQKSEPL